METMGNYQCFRFGKNTGGRVLHQSKTEYPENSPLQKTHLLLTGLSADGEDRDCRMMDDIVGSAAERETAEPAVPVSGNCD
jgi:hypothetical protein